MPYRIVLGEPPEAQMPSRCPVADHDQSCRVCADHWRERKTGPEFPLLVARCRAHALRFTLYPPGFTPYGRQAVAPVDSQGQLVRLGQEEPEDAGEPDWQQTIFSAAKDAASGRLWDPSSPSEDTSRRRTQGRWIGLAASLLGLTVSDQRAREQIAERLGLDGLTVIEAARAFEARLGLRRRGQIIVSLLSRLPIGRCLCDDLLVCGAIAGLWGRPSRWDPGGPLGGVFRPLFRGAEHPLSEANDGAKGCPRLRVVTPARSRSSRRSS